MTWQISQNAGGVQVPQWVGRLIRDDHAQDLVEYAMLLALIALVVVGGVTVFGTTISNGYTTLSGSFGFGGGSYRCPRRRRTPGVAWH
jgi:Flp pilus assembly pilin Flp